MNRKSKRKKAENRTSQATTAVCGGQFKPLSDKDMSAIHSAALEILSTVGMSDAPELVEETVLSSGGKLSQDGRLLFPKDMVEGALGGSPKQLLLAGRDPDHDMHLSGYRVFVGTGGAAPMMVDLDTGAYRPSVLQDLFEAARIVDSLDNVNFFSRPVVARDIENPLELDVNTAFASLAGTSKHVMVSAQDPESVNSIARMCDMVAGGREKFQERPFLSLNINHAVPPLRFSKEACAVLAEAVKLGIPAHVNTFGQLGASSPVTISGCLAQTVAETLAGMTFAWLLNPEAKLIFGMRPMVTDLRTGGMAGGSGEQALLTASAVQMAQFYKLPNSTIAGASDSKVPDAQSGYEKCISVSLAAHAGANMITQACGMQAGLMGCSLESLVIDNDLLGTVLRTMIPVDVSNETLSIEGIRDAVSGEGHFLGHEDTLARMQSDFLYPDTADRLSPEEWAEAGSLDARQRANARVRELLSSQIPRHMQPDLEKLIRSEFEIKLPVGAMESK